MDETLIDAYRSDGYAIARGQISADLVAEMDAHYEWLRAQPQPESVSPIKDGPLHEVDAFTVRAASEPTLLEIVEAIVGPDIALSHADYIPKYPGEGRSFNWHADAQLISQMFDDIERFTQVWIALDPATVESGCLRVLPGSHKSGWQSRLPVDGDLWQTLLDEGLARDEDVVDIELDPGDAFIFHGWTLHASQPNRSSHRRCGFNFHYVDANVGVMIEGANDFGVVLQGSSRNGWASPPRWAKDHDFAFRGADAYA